jgi:hypothetical protein
VSSEDYTVEITAGKPELVGIYEQAPGLIRIRLPLSPRPDARWITIFNELPPGVTSSMSMHHPPQASSGSIAGLTPDDMIESYVAHIRERVAGANTYYNAEIAPGLKAAVERVVADDDEEQRRLNEIRKRLENL